jgi:CHAT domain-containing protein
VGESSPAALLAARFDLGPLPAAAAELERVTGALPGRHRVRLGRDATEAEFREAVAAGAQVVHLAAHTVVDERPGRGAAILLSPDGEDDGLLRPEEVAALPYRARLTVLAACRTALDPAEDGRALSSLTGAFVAAGSGAVVATLWDVGDAATAAFMEQFYFELARGRAPAAALTRAKRRLAADPRWADPSLWAAYVLVGEAPPPAPRPALPAAAIWLAAAAVAAAALAATALAARRRARLTAR